jgi:hypothetical protein
MDTVRGNFYGFFHDADGKSTVFRSLGRSAVAFQLTVDHVDHLTQSPGCLAIEQKSNPRKLKEVFVVRFHTVRR